MENQKEVELMTSSELLVKHKLTWTVSKQDIVVNGKVSDKFKMLVRDDTGYEFMTVKNGYFPIQVSTLTDLGDQLVETGQAKYVDAGSYKGGSVVWVRMQITESNFDVVKGDTIATYIKLMNSNDGSIKIIGFPEAKRLQCANGMTAHFQDYTKTFGVKHTRNAKQRFLFNARDLLKREIEYFKIFAESLREMSRKEMNSLAVDNFLLKLFDIKENSDWNKDVSTRTKNQIQKIKELTHSGTGVDIDGIRNTAYGTYNAVTEYVDKYRLARSNDENREFSANHGTGQDIKEKAYALLTQ